MIVSIRAFLLICSSIICAAQNQTLPLKEFNNRLSSDFHEMDLNKNGTVDVLEFEQRIHRQDYDKDGCISFHEFLRRRIHDSLEFAWAVFNHFDHNKDDCLEIKDEIDEFREIDVSPKDGAITEGELDNYYDRIFGKILQSLQYST